MRINSNYKDYYDHLQKYVYGNSTSWNRAWCNFSANTDICAGEVDRKMWYHAIIGFCGSLYGFLRVAREIKETIKVDGKDRINTKTIYENAWSIDELVDLLSNKSFYYFSKDDIRKYQNLFYVKKDDSVFIQQNSPIFVVTHNQKVCCPLNPTDHTQFEYSLKDLRFDTIVDDKEAYSKIVDYINFLGMEHKFIPQMSNDQKIDSHGFDKKSFRK